ELILGRPAKSRALLLGTPICRIPNRKRPLLYAILSSKFFVHFPHPSARLSISSHAVAPHLQRSTLRFVAQKGSDDERGDRRDGASVSFDPGGKRSAEVQRTGCSSE